MAGARRSDPDDCLLHCASDIPLSGRTHTGSAFFFEVNVSITELSKIIHSITIDVSYIPVMEGPFAKTGHDGEEKN